MNSKYYKIIRCRESGEYTATDSRYSLKDEEQLITIIQAETWGAFQLWHVSHYHAPYWADCPSPSDLIYKINKFKQCQKTIEMR